LIFGASTGAGGLYILTPKEGDLASVFYGTERSQSSELKNPCLFGDARSPKEQKIVACVDHF
jgi:hypothetical protein